MREPSGMALRAGRRRAATGNAVCGKGRSMPKPEGLLVPNAANVDTLSADKTPSPPASSFRLSHPHRPRIRGTRRPAETISPSLPATSGPLRWCSFPGEAGGRPGDDFVGGSVTLKNSNRYSRFMSQRLIAVGHFVGVVTSSQDRWFSVSRRPFHGKTSHPVNRS